MEIKDGEIKERVREAFRNYLKGDKSTISVFIKTLKQIERDVIKDYKGSKKDKSIWFRTFAGNTGADTIHDIERDLSGKSGLRNMQHCIECMQIGIDTDIQVNFS